MAKGLKVAAIVLGGVAVLFVVLAAAGAVIGSKSMRQLVSRLPYASRSEVEAGAGTDVSALPVMMDRTMAVQKSEAMGAYAPNAAPVAADSVSQAPDRLVIRTGELSIVVRDVQSAVKTIVDYANLHGGYVVSSNIVKTGLAPLGIVTVRIPSKNLDRGIVEVKTLGEVTNERVDGQDVTEEFVDLGARLKNLRATETQFLLIMAKAKKIPDILDVQNELSNIRGQIEQLEGRMKYLKQNSDLASLTVNLSTDQSVLPAVDQTDQWDPMAVLKEASRNLVTVGKKLASFFIWFGVFLPLWIIIILVLWLIGFLLRRSKKKAEKEKSTVIVGQSEVKLNP